MNMEKDLYPKASAPPSPYYLQTTNQPKSPSDEIYSQNLDFFIKRYEISRSFAERLNNLRGYEIVFICDDSGSMNSPIGETIDPYQNQRTRWDELKQMVSIVVDLASLFDPDGVDVYFLNREPMLNVQNSSQLENLFIISPEGSTPIVPVLREVLQKKRNHIYERKLLILIATDGIPTDQNQHTDISTFENVLTNERKPIDHIPVTIIVCTDDQNTMNYLNNWDKKIPNLDVVENYRTEKKQIETIRGKNVQFSFGDYIVKTLMGGIDPSFDHFDEPN